MSSSSHSSFSQLGNSWSDGERSIVCEDEQAGKSCQSERIWSISSLTDSPAGASDSLSMCEEQTEESFKSENIWSSQACTEEDEGNEEEESPSLGNLSSDKINNTSTGVRDHFIAPHQGGAGASTAYKQQTLPAQQLILTVRTVLPAFFIIGLIYIPIGIALYVSSNNIKDFEVDYTGVDTSSPCYSCAKNLMWNSTGPCLCTVTFSLDQPFENNVFMYYGLSNFYQSHRRYVNSRDDSQLTGNPFALKNPSTVCEPYRTSDGLPIAPCGAIANSLFNDTLELYYIDNGTRTVIPMVKEGIAWQKDKYKKFRNPKGNKNLTVAFQGTTKPVNWRKSVYELDPYDPKNNGFINEDLLVWMRTAALPTFRKLYRIIQKKLNTTSTLPSGNYELDITYNYPVLSFDGRKRMILSTISWMGGKNPFLGIAYITVGSICFFLGVALLIIHWYWDYWNYWENFKV